jgi:hypothetical protein
VVPDPAAPGVHASIKTEARSSQQTLGWYSPGHWQQSALQSAPASGLERKRRTKMRRRRRRKRRRTEHEYPTYRFGTKNRSNTDKRHREETPRRGPKEKHVGGER